MGCEGKGKVQSTKWKVNGVWRQCETSNIRILVACKKTIDRAFVSIYEPNRTKFVLLSYTLSYIYEPNRTKCQKLYILFL